MAGSDDRGTVKRTTSRYAKKRATGLRLGSRKVHTIGCAGGRRAAIAQAHEEASPRASRRVELSGITWRSILPPATRRVYGEAAGRLVSAEAAESGSGGRRDPAPLRAPRRLS